MKGRGIAVRGNALLDFIIVFQSYDYISLFEPCVDIPANLCCFF